MFSLDQWHYPHLLEHFKPSCVKLLKHTYMPTKEPGSQNTSTNTIIKWPEKTLDHVWLKAKWTQYLSAFTTRLNHLKTPIRTATQTVAKLSSFARQPKAWHTNSRLGNFGKLRSTQLLPLPDNLELYRSVATSASQVHYYVGIVMQLICCIQHIRLHRTTPHGFLAVWDVLP